MGSAPTTVVDGGSPLRWTVWGLAAVQLAALAMAYVTGQFGAVWFLGVCGAAVLIAARPRRPTRSGVWSFVLLGATTAVLLAQVDYGTLNKGPALTTLLVLGVPAIVLARRARVRGLSTADRTNEERQP